MRCFGQGCRVRSLDGGVAALGVSGFRSHLKLLKKLPTFQLSGACIFTALDGIIGRSCFSLELVLHGLYFLEKLANFAFL